MSKKYNVTFPYHTTITITVDADDEDDAIEKAEALLGVDEEAEDIQIHANLIENGCAEVTEVEDEDE